MAIRTNYAEGRFYPSSREELVKQLDRELIEEKRSISYSLKDRVLIGGVVPHAGHIFCARQAIHFFEIVRASEQPFDTVIIIHPNHTGVGEPISIDSHQQWRTPLGVMPIDVEMANLLGIPMEEEAQRYEHSAEVILPYIQHFLGSQLKLLPINMLAQNYANATALAMKIKRAVDLTSRRVMVIASSDFCHYKNPSLGYDLDSYALEALLDFELEEFESRVKAKNISICGFGAIMALFQYAALAAPGVNVKVLKRGHSGEIYPSQQVVDYISMLLYR